MPIPVVGEVEFIPFVNKKIDFYFIQCNGLKAIPATANPSGRLSWKLGRSEVGTRRSNTLRPLAPVAQRKELGQINDQARRSEEKVQIFFGDEAAQDWCA